MSATVVHLPWRDLESTRAACGRIHPANLTEDPVMVSCQRCRTTLRYKVLALEQEESSVQNGMTREQEQAIDQERHHTVRECVSYLREGDSVACLARLVRGFNRQVRLAGLEHHLREGAPQ